MRDIKDYERLYAVTSCGKVFSYRSQRFLKPGKNKDGYLYVNLYKDGKTAIKYIHRLVGETYLPNPENKPCLNHRDENKANNALPNLEWVTYRENNIYGTRIERAAKSCSKKVICVETNEIFNSIKAAAKEKNADSSSITKACKGKLKTVKGYHWRYYEERRD